MKINYYEVFDLISLEVNFGKDIKNSNSKNERAEIFEKFYTSLYTKAEELWGCYGGFDRRLVNVIYPLIKNKKVWVKT